MFKKISGPKLVKRKVYIYIPTEGEGFAKYPMFITFQIEDKSVIEKRQEEYEAGNPDTDWLNTVIKDWDQYMEDDGKTAVPFNDDELKAFLDKSYCRIACIQEYFNCANGGVGKRKN